MSVKNQEGFDSINKEDQEYLLEQEKLGAKFTIDSEGTVSVRRMPTQKCKNCGMQGFSTSKITNAEGKCFMCAKENK